MAAAQDELEQQRLEGIVPWSLEAERLREAADEATMAEFLRLLVEDLSPHGGEGSDLPEKVAPTGARFLRAVSQPIYVRGATPRSVRGLWMRSGTRTQSLWTRRARPA